MICVFDVTNGPARGRRFWIRPDEKVEIGRISTADFSVPNDQHMSRHHLVLEGVDSAFVVRDVGSSNGTYVNESKVNSIELRDGDQIRAGTTVLAVTFVEDESNPHAVDGFSFSQTAVIEDDIPVPSRSVAVELDDEETTQRYFSPGDQETVLRQRVEDAANSGQANSNWSAAFQFEPTDVEGLYLQKTATIGQLMTDVLRHLESSYSIVAMLATSQLGRFGRKQLEVLKQEDSVARLSEELSVVFNENTQSFRRLAEISQTQNALTLLGHRGEIEPKLVEEISKFFMRPNDIVAQVKAPEQQFKQAVLGRLDFLIFELESSGRLGLFLCE